MFGQSINEAQHAELIRGIKKGEFTSSVQIHDYAKTAWNKEMPFGEIDGLFSEANVAQKEERPLAHGFWTK